MRRFCFAVALLAAAGASAQPTLIASSSRYDASSGTSLVFRNPAATPVTFDSLTVASLRNGENSGGATAVSYRVRVRGQYVGGIVQCVRPDRSCFSDGLFGQTVEPGDSVIVTQVFGFCAACRGTAGGGFADTLRVYSGGWTEPIQVALRNVVFVASEVPPEASALRLGVSPNPSRGASVVQVSHAASGSVRVVAYDALGREAAVLHDGPAAETLTLRLDTAAWAPGVYVVHASSGGAALSRRLVVVR